MTNLIAISAASAAIFLLFGFRPGAETERINILRRDGRHHIIKSSSP